MKHEIPLPPKALEDIVTSPLSKSVLEDCANFDHNTSDFSPSWFEATEIDLNGRPATGLLVRGNQDCLHGAHIVQFWILAKTPTGYRTLFTARSDAIRLLRTLHSGHRDLQLIFMYAAGADLEYVTLSYSKGTYIVASRRKEHH